MARAKARQQKFVWKTRGGLRPGAGRKARPENVGLQGHCARPKFERHVPAHVTMRAMRGVPKMRAQLVARVVKRVIARASEKGFRVIDFSVQDDHLHLLAEGHDADAFSRGMQRLASRIAMAVNALVSRHGRFWRERYHRRDLATPRQFRNALVYVLFNFRKHSPPSERALRANAFDLCSSMIWFDGWKSEALLECAREHRARAGPRPTALPETWLARVGWKRHGLIDGREAPRSPG
jgi:putative transposase